MTTTDHSASDLTAHELAAWRGLLEVHARDRRSRPAQPYRDGDPPFFLDHLTATDQIVLGDVWSRFR